MHVGAATALASAANYSSNVLMARSLSADAFGDAALLVSGLLLISAVALGLQLTVARAMASGQGHAALVRGRHRAAVTGTAIAILIAIASPALASVFSMASAMPLVILAVGVPLFFQASVGRGAAQANREFGRLAASIGLEALVRVITVVVVLALGWGPAGVALALTIAFGAAIVPCWKVVGVVRPTTAVVGTRGAATATVLLLTAQVVIANSDVWIVAAHLPDNVGSYAAVALIGRLVFVAASSVTTVVFPSLVTGGDGSNRLLWTAIGVMAAFGSALTAAAALLGGRLVEGMMGSQYAGAGALLWPYALATTCFVVANMVAISGVAAGRSGPPAMLGAGALAQVVVLALGAQNGLTWVVWAQVAVMGALALTMLSTQAFLTLGHRTRFRTWRATTAPAAA
jgi:O-antigen/teichoic acid export membrane protein